VLVQISKSNPKITKKVDNGKIVGYELKQAEAKYKAVLVAHDMTIKERSEVKTGGWD